MNHAQSVRRHNKPFFFFWDGLEKGNTWLTATTGWLLKEISNNLTAIAETKTYFGAKDRWFYKSNIITLEWLLILMGTTLMNKASLEQKKCLVRSWTFNQWINIMIVLCKASTKRWSQNSILSGKRSLGCIIFPKLFFYIHTRIQKH